ncbi:hypothetical protein B0J12DRAFT_659406 [Macrophomina phaseolina]|uniref:Uncharacterized protein n=1 Tax=Macrophomina phaseolina TaxID=35725 RepID=A0ABQ8GER3_9PEZI|nr:hypothetical protein B0J12DRAFT_659406 [Macrophomina phaseolina]
MLPYGATRTNLLTSCLAVFSNISIGRSLLRLANADHVPEDLPPRVFSPSLRSAGATPSRMFPLPPRKDFQFQLQSATSCQPARHLHFYVLRQVSTSSFPRRRPTSVREDAKCTLEFDHHRILCTGTGSSLPCLLRKCGSLVDCLTSAELRRVPMKSCRDSSNPYKVGAEITATSMSMRPEHRCVGLQMQVLGRGE